MAKVLKVCRTPACFKMSYKVCLKSWRKENKICDWSLEPDLHSNAYSNRSELSWWYFCLGMALHCAPVSILKHVFWWFTRIATFWLGDLLSPHCTIPMKKSSEESELSYFVTLWTFLWCFVTVWFWHTIVKQFLLPQLYHSLPCAGLGWWW